MIFKKTLQFNIMKINKIAVYHYPCPDGELSATIFFERYDNVYLIPWTHENKVECIKNIKNIIKLYSLYKNNTLELYFLDCCPEFKFIIDIKESFDKIQIIDHHMSACNQFKDSMKEEMNLSNLNLIFDNSKSGCMLTWEYCYPNLKYPLPVKYIGERDIWVWDDVNTEPFTTAYNTFYDISSNMNNLLRISKFSKVLNSDKNTINMIIELGKKEINVMKSEAKQLILNYKLMVDTDINDTELKIVQVPMSKYHLTKYILEEACDKFPKYDVLRLEYSKEDKKVYSLRVINKNVRVDLLAQKYGGNGHMKASGYSISK